jgi:hypothetical protein
MVDRRRILMILARKPLIRPEGQNPLVTEWPESGVRTMRGMLAQCLRQFDEEQAAIEAPFGHPRGGGGGGVAPAELGIPVSWVRRRN